MNILIKWIKHVRVMCITLERSSYLMLMTLKAAIIISRLKRRVMHGGAFRTVAEGVVTGRVPDGDMKLATSFSIHCFRSFIFWYSSGNPEPQLLLLTAIPTSSLSHTRGAPSSPCQHNRKHLNNSDDHANSPSVKLYYNHSWPLQGDFLAVIWGTALPLPL